MAITFSDDWAWVTFDSGWELLWVLLLAFVVGAIMGVLITLYDPALADRLIFRPAVAAARLIKSMLAAVSAVPAALGVA